MYERVCRTVFVLAAVIVWNPPTDVPEYRATLTVWSAMCQAASCRA